MLAELSLAFGLLLLGLLASWQTRRLRSLARLLQRTEAERGALEQEMHALLEVSRSLGQRLRDQQGRLSALEIRVQTLADGAAPGTPAHHPQRLLDEGLEVDKVASLCELSQGEAALLSRWRARRAAA